jgi:hypothetical protein
VRPSALALALVAILGAAAPAPALERVRGVLHVHSDLTTGDFTLESLVGLADQQGIGALLLAENYKLRVSYGLPPFRALTRVTRSEASVGDAPAQYLDRVAAVQRRLPHVLLIPGVEVMPHYHWTGSPIALDMTVHELQKNLLVFGIGDPAALRTLPVPGQADGEVTVQSLLDALPVLLLVPGLVLLLRRRPVRRGLGRGAVVVVRQRAWVRGAVLSAIGLVALVRGWPFLTDRYPTWREAGVAPYQALIDRVEQLGGASVWSFPEARDIGEQRYGPVRVSWLTEPYPDDLLKTFRYTAFGAVYEDTTTFERPGGGWDRLLAEYARGERSRPAWASTASARASRWDRCRPCSWWSTRPRRACSTRSAAGGCTPRSARASSASTWPSSPRGPARSRPRRGRRCGCRPARPSSWPWRWRRATVAPTTCG